MMIGKLIMVRQLRGSDLEMCVPASMPVHAWGMTGDMHACTYMCMYDHALECGNHDKT